MNIREEVERQIEAKVLEIRKIRASGGRPGLEPEPEITDEAVSSFVTAADWAIRSGRKKNWSDEMILAGVRNRLEVGRQVAATSFDKDGNPLPDRTPDAQAYADAVTDWALVAKRFHARLRENRIPTSEYEAAMPVGSAAYRELVKRWGAERAPDEGKERGDRAPGTTPRETKPGEPAPTPGDTRRGEAVMKAARAAGRPVRTYSDYKAARREFGGGDAA